MHLLADLDPRQLVERQTLDDAHAGAGDQSQLGQIAQLHRISVRYADHRAGSAVRKLGKRIRRASKAALVAQSGKTQTGDQRQQATIGERASRPTPDASVGA